MSGISEDKLAKALANIDALSKSHETVTTKVEGMAGQSGTPQIFHTPANSDPGSWAGSTAQDVPGNGPGVDKISENGTDLRMMKSILAKLAKGMDLSDDEKKVVAKAMEHDDEKEDKQLIRQMVPGAKDKDKDDKKDVKKSLLETASESPAMREGFEMSTFLKDQTAAISKSLEGIEARLSARLDAQVAALRTEYAEVSKSLTAYVGDVGTVVGATARKLETLENSAARPPKSAIAANNALNKSLGAGNGETLSKALVSAALHEMMVKREITSLDAIKFDTTGELPRDLEAKVRVHLGR